MPKLFPKHISTPLPSLRIAVLAIMAAIQGSASAEMPEIRQDDLDSSLVDAARQGDLASFNLALRLGANLNARDRHGNNAVLAAVECGQSRLLRQLLDKHVDPDNLGASGFTPLTYAAMVGATDSVVRLLQAGASVDLPNALGNTPLHLASQFGRNTVLQVLVKEGARIDPLDGNGDTPLLVALHAGQRKAFLELLAAGANPNVRDRIGQSALSIAIMEERTDMALTLLQQGAEFRSTTGSYTPLRLAKLFGLQPVADELVRRGAPE